MGYATTNDPTTNECYNEQFLSIKSGTTTNTDATTNAEAYYFMVFNVFIMESSIIVIIRERLFALFMCVRLFRESLLIVFTKERLFVLFMCVRLYREGFFVVFTKERLFVLFMCLRLFRESFFIVFPRKDCSCSSCALDCLGKVCL
jgi:hypothetical protein